MVEALYIKRIDTLQATATADPTNNWVAVGSNANTTSLVPSGELALSGEGCLERPNSCEISTGGRGLSAAAAMVVTSLTLTEAETMVSLPPPAPFPSSHLSGRHNSWCIAICYYACHYYLIIPTQVRFPSNIQNYTAIFILLRNAYSRHTK